MLNKEIIERRLQTLKFLDERSAMFFPTELRISGIYAILNKANGKIYIGKTSAKIYRYLRRERIEKLIKGEMHNRLLQQEFKIFGRRNFCFFIIEKILNDDSSEHFQKELNYTLNNLEVYYIDKFQTSNRDFGYNFEIGGNNEVSIDDIKSIIDEEFKRREKWVYGELYDSKQIGFGISRKYIKERIKFPHIGLGSVIDNFLKQEHNVSSFEEYLKKFLETYGHKDYVKNNLEIIPYLLTQQLIKKYPFTEII